MEQSNLIDIGTSNLFPPKSLVASCGNNGLRVGDYHVNLDDLIVDNKWRVPFRDSAKIFVYIVEPNLSQRDIENSSLPIVVFSRYNKNAYPSCHYISLVGKLVSLSCDNGVYKLNRFLEIDFDNKIVTNGENKYYYPFDIRKHCLKSTYACHTVCVFFDKNNLYQNDCYPSVKLWIYDSEWNSKNVVADFIDDKIIYNGKQMFLVNYNDTVQAILKILQNDKVFF